MCQFLHAPHGGMWLLLVLAVFPLPQVTSSLLLPHLYLTLPFTWLLLLNDCTRALPTRCMPEVLVISQQTFLAPPSVSLLLSISAAPHSLLREPFSSLALCSCMSAPLTTPVGTSPGATSMLELELVGSMCVLPSSALLEAVTLYLSCIVSMSPS